jgi:hypothetical protein
MGRRTIVISLREILVFLFILILISGVTLLVNSAKIDLEPSLNINGSQVLFEEKQNPFFKYEIIKYHSRINITEFNSSPEFRDIGMNVDRNNLYLGKIPKGSKSRKTINLTNRQDKAYELRFYIFGNISELVNIKRKLTLQPGENLEHQFIAETDLSTETGMYYGEVDVVTLIPKNFIGKILKKVI